MNSVIDSLERWPLERLKPFQGNLKKVDASWIQALANRIKRKGFSAPILVWKDHDAILDGHQRLAALQLLESQGETLGDIPVVLIEAKDEQEAKERLLEYNTIYSKIDQEVFEDWSDELDLEDLNLIGMESEIPDETTFPSLGEKSGFTNMCFTLSEGQAEKLTSLPVSIKHDSNFDTDNANSNGNALMVIIDAYKA